MTRREWEAPVLREDAQGGTTVLVGGVAQSYVRPADPGFLGFEYLQHLGHVLDTLGPPPPARLAVTHVGGGGLSLARYVQHTRPGSPQIVLEPHAALTDAVRRALPLPRGHRIRVRPVDGLAGVAHLADASADVVLLDAFDGARIPGELATTGFLREVARVLRPAGTLAANLADAPGTRYLSRWLATVAAVGCFDDVALVAGHDVLKRHRFGNVVAVARRGAPVPVARLRRAVAGSPGPTGMSHGPAVAALAAAARPFLDPAEAASPEPPPGFLATT